MVYSTPVKNLRGVGEAKEKALAKLGIQCAGDILRHYPRAYQNRAAVITAAEAGMTDGPVSLVLTVDAEPKDALIRRGMRLLKVRASDGTGVVHITFFNQPYLKDVFRPDATFRFYGKAERVRSAVTMSSPVWEVCPEGDESRLKPIMPVYPLTAGIGQKFMADLVSQVIKGLGDIPDMLPPPVILDNSLCTENTALNNIHFPQSEKDIANARRRLAFDEFYLASTALALRKSKRNLVPASPMTDPDTSGMCGLFPYELTGAQKRCVSEIAADMGKTVPMKRILCGDVGSGKTAVAAAAAYIAVNNGYQAALMAPTELLAKQHYAFFEPLFTKLGFECALLCGSMTKKEKDGVRNRLCAKENPIDFVIGTHALLTDSVHFSRLALVITDEQHRFGVTQRAALEEKSRAAHTLVMSATPIPRTLTLVKYGDLDISRLDEMPAGRKKIGTFAVDSTYRRRLNGFIEKQVSEGHQVYVVCPAIEDKPKKTEDAEELYDIDFALEHTEALPVLSATECAANLAAELPGVRVGCVHGKMKSAERDAVMDAFVSGQLDVLAATTVIEVGINVPSATLMVVENAERFGLSQLHQLRGRVGRGKDKSWCILMSDTKSEKSRARLEIMEKCSDGFAIAEEDLRLRGPGDFFASGGDVRQSGELSFSAASGCTDGGLIAAAASAAVAAVEADPALEREENHLLRRRVEELLDDMEKRVN